MKRTKVDCHYDTIVLIIVGYLVTIQTCETWMYWCSVLKKTLNIIPTLNLLDLDSNPRPVPPDMAPAKKPKYISIYLWDDKKNVCSEKNKKICTYLCAKNKGQERLYNLCRVRFIEVKMVKLDITGVESLYGNRMALLFLADQGWYY